MCLRATRRGCWTLPGATRQVRRATERCAQTWTGASVRSEAERRVLYRLAVLHTGWTFAEAQTACGAENLAMGLADVVDSLVARSLINVEHGGIYTRYALLETVRRY